MGKRSTKENKNYYHICRENAGLTREQAENLMATVSADKIERIENERALPHPEDVLEMAKCYNAPDLCNYYCSKNCPIGMEHVPEVKIKDLSQITLEMLASLNAINNEKNRLVEITVDGKISEEEMEDYNRIKAELDKIAIATESLRLWVQKSLGEND